MSQESYDILNILKNRGKVIIKTSIIAILTNVFLAIFKAILGLFVNSIALILDAVNNLSDALSSVVTIIGEKIASKAPDKKHPMGYGRIEYISSMIIAALVLYAGITSLVESVKKILNPSPASYTILSIVVIGLAVVVKFILGTYVKEQGKKVNSTALIASGSDALFDAILSFSVFLSAIIFTIWGISLEAYVGIVISIFMIKAGIEIMLSTIDDLIGHRADHEMVKRIKKLVSEEEQVLGVYDLALFNYGPNKYYSSLHVELPDKMQVDEVDKLTRKLQHKIYKKTGVILIALGVYSFNTKDKKATEIRETVEKKILSHDWALQVHGFYCDIDKNSLRFDVVLSFDIKVEDALKIINKEVKDLYPDYKIQIVPDLDL
ncbi:MAG: cation diffusion facilitator family transporter [Peptoniphilaceae bacterium]|uniref:cation diffusion facilitator family transporter n=1 Tax=Peptoniphilus sp. TaxID=1971214 RepID=UPI00297B027E|nr:cation diffusion facilitator family transporter [Peptoniphilus sp.]MDD7352943.1 cation diffusion facilitator family transporter [Peptoniphilaceae bacterium]MDY3902407.1 cation diffusion facilitator family transporter [Peptoniphilus sp.]